MVPARAVHQGGRGVQGAPRRADAAAIETAIELARDGHAVVIFPEGTRRKKGMVKKYEARAHTGAARVALGPACR